MLKKHFLLSDVYRNTIFAKIQCLVNKTVRTYLKNHFVNNHLYIYLYEKTFNYFAIDSHDYGFQQRVVCSDKPFGNENIKDEGCTRAKNDKERKAEEA